VVLVADGSLIQINRHHTNHKKAVEYFPWLFCFGFSGKTYLIIPSPNPVKIDPKYQYCMDIDIVIYESGHDLLLFFYKKQDVMT
jgi:hypothetical protein